MTPARFLRGAGVDEHGTTQTDADEAPGAHRCIVDLTRGEDSTPAGSGPVVCQELAG